MPMKSPIPALLISLSLFSAATAQLGLSATPAVPSLPRPPPTVQPITPPPSVTAGSNSAMAVPGSVNAPIVRQDDAAPNPVQIGAGSPFPARSAGVAQVAGNASASLRTDETVQEIQ